ncbi:MAG: hypothetical protein Q7R35_13245 [Elusimicrobiota bacterium]|nr:hypothetical protein [Elusimicrobiota bacterium]
MIELWTTVLEEPVSIKAYGEYDTDIVDPLMVVKLDAHTPATETLLPPMIATEFNCV